MLVPYGFAFARVDIRGSGDSDGVLLGEYLQQEQDDALEVIAWLARQPWSNGAVGMRGISWGGFSSLQAAALAPPALKAIIPQCASDNRYTDDAHYVGGALTLDNYDWGAEFKTVLVGPPDPAIVGPRWREMWMQRLKSTPPILAEWLSHQRYDAFWQHGSVAVDYSSIKCPVYVVDGQIDSYRDFLPRLLTHLKVPRKGLMGPWGHKYPQLADAGPGLDWVTEEVRWWTQWLLGVDTGIMDEPMLRVFMEERTAAEVWPRDVPGRWVTEPSWPSPHIQSRTLFLNVDGLSERQGNEAVRQIHSQETLGLTKREWFPWNLNIDLPPDQTPDDKRSLTFDSAPLTEDLEMLGRPMASIRVASTEPVAKLVVRINEVTPEGVSWSVSYGVLNLTHRDGHERPAALEPGRHYDVEVPCYFTAHRFKRGNRIRVAISESIWPMLWPSPKPVRLDITAGASRLSLPVRPNDVESGSHADRAAAGSRSTRSGRRSGRLQGSKHQPDGAGCRRARAAAQAIAGCARDFVGHRHPDVGRKRLVHVHQGGRSEQQCVAAGMVQQPCPQRVGYEPSIDARAHVDRGAFSHQGIDSRERAGKDGVRAALGSRDRTRPAVNRPSECAGPPAQAPFLLRAGSGAVAGVDSAPGLAAAGLAAAGLAPGGVETGPVVAVPSGPSK